MAFPAPPRQQRGPFVAQLAAVPSAGTAFDPSTLGSKLKLWIDPSDATTVFSNSTGTTPATLGGNVDWVTDKTGATHLNAQFNFPTWNLGPSGYYFNFTSPMGQATAASVALSGSDEVHAFVAVQQNASALGIILELSSNSDSVPGAWFLAGGENTGVNYRVRMTGTSLTDDVTTTAGTYAAGTYAVLHSHYQRSANLAEVTVNQSGEHVSASSNSLGAGNAAADVLWIGSRGTNSLGWNGRIYGILIVSGAMTAAEIADCEKWCAVKAGIVGITGSSVAAAAPTHDASGAAVGPGSSVTGAAVYNALHSSTGALTGQGSSTTGAATRFRAHAATGALTGQSSAVAGSATRLATHAATGALVGPGATVAGTSVRFRAFASTGALVGPGATVVGSAARVGAPNHTATGALIGAGAALTGAAVLTRLHSASGALGGGVAAVVATAARIDFAGIVPPVVVPDGWTPVLPDQSGWARRNAGDADWTERLSSDPGWRK